MIAVIRDGQDRRCRLLALASYSQGQQYLAFRWARRTCRALRKEDRLRKPFCKFLPNGEMGAVWKEAQAQDAVGGRPVTHEYLAEWKTPTVRISASTLAKIDAARAEKKSEKPA